MGTVVAPAAERRELGITSDHDLVAAVRTGDDRAFERLYERYHRRIAAYVYGMVNDYGRAEDITQDVFISALRRMRETERPIAFKPWIYEIAKNACIDQFRRSRRAEEISYDAEEGVGALESTRLASADAGPDDAVDAKQQLDNLCGAFGGLSETHHQILVMRELEGLSYREIGEKMGLSRPSVESTLFRARRRLTEEYDELVSGERCTRVQAIILGASGGTMGARDQRRLLRHVAHCQPCRREARLAGLQVGSFSRRPARDAIAARVAALLPLPFFFRGRRGGTVDPGLVTPLSTMAEPIAGWTKAVAAAATIIVAGAGAGAVSQVASDGDVLDDLRPAPAAVEKAPSAIEKRDAPRTADRPSNAVREPQLATQRRSSGSRKAGGGTTQEAQPPLVNGAEPSEEPLIPTPPPSGPSDPTTILPPPPGGDDPSGDPGTPGGLTVPASAGQAAEEAADVAHSADPRLGSAVRTVVSALGGG